MSLPSSEIESGLKAILSKRTITEEPKTGRCSWIYFAKLKPEPGEDDIYKMSHTGRIDAHLEIIKKDTSFSDEEPIILKVWNGADYFKKVLRRILKPNNLGSSGAFQLSGEDVEWLKSIRLCKSFGLESEVADLLGADTLSALRKRRWGINNSSGPKEVSPPFLPRHIHF